MIEIDLQAGTNIKGLFAAEDEVGNFRVDISGAAVFGWIAGGSAARRAKQISTFQKVEVNDRIEKRIQLFTDIMERKNGPSWREVNQALQQIMGDYAGVGVRSDSLLNAGLKYLKDLRTAAHDTLSADNSHTLMRSLETLDLMECREVIFLSASERKETRGMHKRSDYPFTNPLLQDRFLTIRRENGHVLLEWRDKQH